MSFAAPPDDSFVQHINANRGIAWKVARAYFADRDDQQDVVQEMMYQLWRSYSRFSGQSKFSTWMYSVCLNTALTYRKKTGRRQSESLSDRHHTIAEQHPGHEDDVALLFEAIGKLSALNKAIVLLYLDDLSYEEIAGITGLTRSNVSVRLVRIKKELETYLRSNI